MIEGRTSRPIACILSSTRLGPWSRPGASSAVRTCSACFFTSSPRFVGESFGLGWRAAPAQRPGRGRVCLPSGGGTFSWRCCVRRGTCSPIPRGTCGPLRDRATAAGSTGWLFFPHRSEQLGSGASKTIRSVTEVLIQNYHRCPATQTDIHFISVAQNCGRRASHAFRGTGLSPSVQMRGTESVRRLSPSWLKHRSHDRFQRNWRTVEYIYIGSAH